MGEHVLGDDRRVANNMHEIRSLFCAAIRAALLAVILGGGSS